MTFNTKTKVWQNVEDEVLPMPLTREVADAKAKVMDSGELWSFNGAASLDPEGRPHILINLGEDIGRITGGPKRVTHYRWDGSNWVGGTPVGPLRGRADLKVTSETELSLYTTYPDEDGNAVIARRDSTDAGQSFAPSKILFERGRGAYVMSSLIEDAHPDARLVATPRTSDKALKNMYLIGDNGPVQRRQK